jgi:hypothetical protein
MYWPIGAPRIYAASNSRSQRDRILEPDDDAESCDTTEETGSLAEAPKITTEGRAEDEHEATSGVSTPVTPMTPGIKPVEHDIRFSSRLTGNETLLSGSAENEPLLTLRISRTGHLFAVITSTSLTIWQTKVCSSKLFYENNESLNRLLIFL